METEKKAQINLRILTSLDEDGKVNQKVLDYVDHLNILNLDRHKRMARNDFEFDVLLNRVLERDSPKPRIYEVAR
jgi:hypothetical protein